MRVRVRVRAPQASRLRELASRLLELALHEDALPRRQPVAAGYPPSAIQPAGYPPSAARAEGSAALCS